MDIRTITSLKLRNSLSLLVSLTLIALSAHPAGAEGGSLSKEETSRLEQMERHFFMQTSTAGDVGQRLSRLEKRIFGDVMTGSPGERLSRMAALLPPKVEQETGRGSEDRVEAEQTNTAVTASGAHFAARSAPPTAASDPDEQELAIERARVSVMAAKEEEIRSLLAEGVELWRARRAQEAQDKFEQVIRLDPHNAEAHFSLGIIAEAAGNLVEAVASYRLASKARPDNSDYKSAIEAAEKKLSAKGKVDSEKAEIRRLAEDAMAAYKRGEYMSALDLYMELDRKTPNQHLVKYNIGTVLLVMKYPERALQYYKQARKLCPHEEKYVKTCDQLKSVVTGQAQQQKQSPRAVAKNNVMGGALEADPAPPGQDLMANLGILGKASGSGVVVTTVGIASRASRIGLQKGDIIRSVEGTMVKNPREINQILAHKSPSEAVQMVVQRNNNLAQISL